MIVTKMEIFPYNRNAPLLAGVVQDVLMGVLQLGNDAAKEGVVMPLIDLVV